MEYYKAFRNMSKSERHYNIIAEKFFLVLASEEYRARRNDAVSNGTLNMLKDEFVDRIFPETMRTARAGRTPEEAAALLKGKRWSIHYEIRKGDRLAAAVRRYGYGILLRLRFRYSEYAPS